MYGYRFDKLTTGRWCNTYNYPICSWVVTTFLHLSFTFMHRPCTAASMTPAGRGSWKAVFPIRKREFAAGWWAALKGGLDIRAGRRAALKGGLHNRAARRDALNNGQAGCTKGRAGGLQKTASCRTGWASGQQNRAGCTCIRAVGCRKGRAVR